MVYKFNFRFYQTGGTRWLQGFHASGIANDAEAKQVGKAWWDEYCVALLPLMSPQTVYDGFEYRPIDEASIPAQYESYQSGMVGGNATNNALPPSATVCLSFKGYNAPPNRGRMFISGWASVIQDKGIVYASVVDAVQDFGDYMVGPSFGGGVAAQLCVARVIDGPPYSINENPLTVASVRNLIGTKQSRKVGTGY